MVTSQTQSGMVKRYSFPVVIADAIMQILKDDDPTLWADRAWFSLPVPAHPFMSVKWTAQAARETDTRAVRRVTAAAVSLRGPRSRRVQVPERAGESV